MSYCKNAESHSTFSALIGRFYLGSLWIKASRNRDKSLKCVVLGNTRIIIALDINNLITHLY